MSQTVAPGHILIIRPPIDEGHVRRYDVECPGVTDACRMWVECPVPDCGPADRAKAEQDGSYVAHGVEHRRIGDLEWCIPTDACFAADNPDLTAAADDCAHTWPPGLHPVRIDWGPAVDGSELYLARIEGAGDGTA